MNVLFVVSECMPFSVTGGLAEVAGSLPKALKKQGVNIKVIMPLYKKTWHTFHDELKFVGKTTTKLAWRSQYCGLFTLKRDGISYYFVDNKYYFDRDNLYGHYDDGERFAFFSKTIFDCIPLMKFIPDIIHCHDHQTGMVCIYLDLLKRNQQFLHTKSIFTIHNIEYQGKYDLAILGDVFDIPSQYRDIVAYNNLINVMKGAIVCADLVTTVSPRYAREITTIKYGAGLHHIINANQQKLIGILNGINTQFYNSNTDDAIVQKYNLKTINDKIYNKRAMQKAFNLEENDEVCLISIISRLATHKGMDLIVDAIDEMMQENIQVIVLGLGETYYEEKFQSLMKKYPRRFYAIIAFDTNLSKQIYSASDIFLMPSRTEPCGLSQMIACRYGTVPIVRATGGLYDSINENNGFVFKEYTSEALLLKVKEAVAVFQNKKQFKKMVKNAYQSDFTWPKSAAKYYENYKKLIGENE